MTPEEFVRACLRQLGVTADGDLRTYIKEDIANRTNQAFQFLWNWIPRERRTHYTKGEITVALVAGVRKYDLPNSSQSLLAPVRYTTDDVELSPVNTKWDILNFDKTNPDLASNTRPLAYFIDRVNAGSADAVQNEAIKSILYVAPAPVTGENLSLDIETEAPHIEYTDFCAVDAPQLPMPHQYVESILLPVTAWFCTRSFYFNQLDKTELFKADFETALQMAGATDTQIATLLNREVPSNV